MPAGPVTLTWQASSGATSYEYCYNTSAYCGVWESTTSTSKTTISLQAATTYVWQIRAVNAAGTTYANDATWWTFTTAPMDAPGTFNKTKPLSGVMIDSPTAVTMMWEASKGATTYQYCYNTSAYCGTWGSTTATSLSVSGLTAGTTYYWHIRAVNPGGTTYSNGGWWTFITYVAPPGAFSKTGPLNGTTLTTPTSATLSWGTSARATSYGSCYDTSNDAACSSTWVGTGATTNAALSGLTAGTTYYWQVRATNPNPSETYADGGWWTFTTRVAPPGAFAKTGPLNLSPTPPDSATLTWEASSGATSYEYCIRHHQRLHVQRHRSLAQHRPRSKRRADRPHAGNDVFLAGPGEERRRNHLRRRRVVEVHHTSSAAGRVLENVPRKRCRRTPESCRVRMGHERERRHLRTLLRHEQQRDV